MGPGRHREWTGGDQEGIRRGLDRDQAGMWRAPGNLEEKNAYEAAVSYEDPVERVQYGICTSMNQTKTQGFISVGENA